MLSWMSLTEKVCSLTGEKLWYKDVQTIGKTSRARRILPDEYKKKFANKQIVCVEYQDITDADEREIFQVCHGRFFYFFFFLTELQRVQLGMALTPSGQLTIQLSQ